MSISKVDISFRADADILLGGWLFLPEGHGPHPAITMCAGFGGTIHHGLEPFAVAFAEAGFATLLHDHRGFGSSGGQPRQDVDPWRQIADWRRAISFLESRPEVDAMRIGLWGTSYSGGHALMLGASDRRLKAIVAQVPTISGYEQGLRRIPADQLSAVDEALAQDDRNQLDGEPGYQALVGADPAVPAAFRSQEAIDFMLPAVPDGVWENMVTLRSSRLARMYEPGAFVSRVSPTPLMFIVAREDRTTPTDLALAAYERALEPKRLVLVPGSHFGIYLTQRDVAIAAAVEWFHEHL
ncbi:alpha/beta hydrolase [Methylobacterium sp. Leaf86]|uniref:alpha/beta hydrolase n=1 Tax=Methylobacterium sp. Leaf86 TaxID=1736242 RepID=UPI000A6AA117|nr:alpha/beta hydrolase [Methylobacterium sp. Leaf86]